MLHHVGSGLYFDNHSGINNGAATHLGGISGGDSVVDLNAPGHIFEDLEQDDLAGVHLHVLVTVMLRADFVVFVAVLNNARHRPGFNHGLLGAVDLSAGIHSFEFVGISVIRAGDVKAFRRTPQFKLPFITFKDRPSPSRRAASVVQEANQALPAGDEGACAFVGDEIALACNARLKSDLRGDHDRGEDAARGTGAKRGVGAETGEGQAAHAVCIEMFWEGHFDGAAGFLEEVQHVLRTGYCIGFVHFIIWVEVDWVKIV